MSKMSEQLKQAATYADLNPRAAELLRNFFLNTATQAEKDELDIWMMASEANDHLFNLLVEVNRFGTGAGTLHLLVKMAQKTPRKKNRVRQVFGWLVLAFLVVTVVDLVIPGRIISSLFTDRPLKSPGFGKKTVVTQASPQVIWLADSTRVELQPYSSLTFPNDFYIDERIVTLKGSARFDVRYEDREPFRVNTGSTFAETPDGAFLVQQDTASGRIVLSATRNYVSFGLDKKNVWGVQQGGKGIFENGTIRLEKPTP